MNKITVFGDPKTLYAKVEYYISLFQTMKVSGTNIYKQRAAEDNYHSNVIEGSRVTYQETLAILNGFSDTVGRCTRREKNEITDYSRAQGYMLHQCSLCTDISELFIIDLHYELMRENRPEIAGHMRVYGEDVTAGNRNVGYTPGEFVDTELEKFFEWYDTVDQSLLNTRDLFDFAVEFKYRFLRIHPFNDGNGRMSRLLLNYLLLRNNMFPLILKLEDKNEYFNAILQTQKYEDLSYYQGALVKIYVRCLYDYMLFI